MTRWNQLALVRSRGLGSAALLMLCTCRATSDPATEPTLPGSSEVSTLGAAPPAPRPDAPPAPTTLPVAASERAAEPVPPAPAAAARAAPAAPAPAAASEASDADTLLLETIGYGLRETPFSAVVQHLSSKATPLGGGEVKVVYQVRVIESIRGPELKTLTYSAVVEKGDEKGLPKKPVILALCKGADGYSWPGIGAQFPSTKQTRAFVTKLRPSLSAEQKAFEFCE